MDGTLGRLQGPDHLEEGILVAGILEEDRRVPVVVDILAEDHRIGWEVVPRIDLEEVRTDPGEVRIGPEEDRRSRLEEDHPIGSEGARRSRCCTRKT